MKKNNNIIYIITIILIIIISLLTINYLNTGKKSSNLEQITHKQIKEKLKNKESFILVISQSTCSHCATYKPKLEQIAKEYGITIYYTNYDEEKNKEKLLEDLNLNGSTPITLFFKDGKETSILNRLEGDLSQQKVIEKFKKMGFIKK